MDPVDPDSDPQHCFRRKLKIFGATIHNLKVQKNYQKAAECIAPIVFKLMLLKRPDNYVVYTKKEPFFLPYVHIHSH